MVVSIPFDYSDKSIIAISARALKPKKIFLGSLFLLIALAFYDICTYLAFAAEGKSVAEVFAANGFFPLKLFCFDSYIAIFIYYYLGFLLVGLSLMTGLTAIASIDYEEFRGNPFMSFSKAVGFGLSRIKQLILSELGISLFILFILLLIIILGLITRIPYVGEFIYSLLFFFPGFIISALTIIGIFALILSFLIVPASTAFDRNGETFNSILELFLTVTRQPVRWIVYTAYNLVSAKICSFIFAYISFRGVQLLKLGAQVGGGEKITTVIASGMAHLPWQGNMVTFINNVFPGIDFNFDISCLAMGTAGNPAGYLMAVSLFLIFLTVCGYIFSVIGTGQAYALAIIRYKRDGYKVTDEEPLYFEEEYINPPIDKSDTIDNE